MFSRVSGLFANSKFCRVFGLMILYPIPHTIVKNTDCVSLEIPIHSWTLIEQLLPILQPLVDATEALSAEEYPSAALY